MPVREEAAADRSRGEGARDASVPTYPPTQDVPTSKAARLARFAGYSAGALALCGYVAAASLITGRTLSIGVAQAAQPSAITGAVALRPDLLGAQLGAPPDGTITPTTRTEETPVSSASPTARLFDEQQDTKDAGTPPATTQATTQPTPLATPQSEPKQPVNTESSTAGHDDSVAVVRQFYRLIRSEPGAAFGLIDPVLGGSDPSGFVSSWSAVRAVNVERVESRPDKSILAVVSLQRSDGRWLVVQQLLRTTHTTPLRIAGVEILSAQLG